MHDTSAFTQSVSFSITKAYTDPASGDHIFQGIASTSNLDSQGDVISPDAMKAAIPGYMVYPALRSMHQPIAAGSVTKAVWTDQGLMVDGIVVDEQEWKKVVKGVYRGLSIGGKVDQAEDQITTDGTKYRLIKALTLTEISLVDRPANPDCKLIMFKADGIDIKGETTKMPQKSKSTAKAEALDARLAAVIAKADVDGDGDDDTGDGSTAPLATNTDNTTGSDDDSTNPSPDSTVSQLPDPDGVVASVTSHMADAVQSGNHDAATLFQQSAALFQAGIAGNTATPAVDTSSDSTDNGASTDGSTDGSAAATATVAAAAKPRFMKAGKAINMNNSQSLWNVINNLLTVLSSSGDTTAASMQQTMQGASQQAGTTGGANSPQQTPNATTKDDGGVDAMAGPTAQVAQGAIDTSKPGAPAVGKKPSPATASRPQNVPPTMTSKAADSVEDGDLQKAEIGLLVKTVDALESISKRLAALETNYGKQPAVGGPNLRSVNKALVGDPAATQAQTPAAAMPLDQQISLLEAVERVETNPFAKSEIRNQIATLEYRRTIGGGLR